MKKSAEKQNSSNQITEFSDLLNGLKISDSEREQAVLLFSNVIKAHEIELSQNESRLDKLKDSFQKSLSHTERTAKLEMEAGIAVGSRKTRREMEEVIDGLKEKFATELAKRDFVISGLRTAAFTRGLSWKQHLLRVWPQWEERKTCQVIEELRGSGLFDAAWYFHANKDVEAAGVDAIEHYVRFGACEGRNPTPIFNTTEYLASHPELARYGINPFVAYVRELSSLSDRVQETGLFDGDWYLSNNPDVAEAGLDPLKHYLQFGSWEGRSPHPKFDMAEFLKKCPDVEQAAHSPVDAFLIASERRSVWL